MCPCSALPLSQLDVLAVPARQYAVNGEGRSFALLPPIDDIAAQAGLCDLILEATSNSRQAPLKLDRD